MQVPRLDYLRPTSVSGDRRNSRADRTMAAAMICSLVAISSFSAVAAIEYGTGNTTYSKLLPLELFLLWITGYGLGVIGIILCLLALLRGHARMAILFVALLFGTASVATFAASHSPHWGHDAPG